MFAIFCRCFTLVSHRMDWYAWRESRYVCNLKFNLPYSHIYFTHYQRVICMLGHWQFFVWKSVYYWITTFNKHHPSQGLCLDVAWNQTDMYLHQHIAEIDICTCIYKVLWCNQAGRQYASIRRFQNTISHYLLTWCKCVLLRHHSGQMLKPHMSLIIMYCEILKPWDLCL